MVNFLSRFKIAFILILGLIFSFVGCSDSKEKKRETINNLSVLRSAARTYYADMGGKWPEKLDDLINKPGYLKKIPEETITGTNRVVSQFDGKGGWVYNSGLVFINLKKYRKRMVTEKKNLLTQTYFNSSGKQKKLSDLRSALTRYYAERDGKLPESLDDLIKKGYLKKIPKERISGTNRVVSQFDGKGGWVYNCNSGDIFINLEEYRKKMTIEKKKPLVKTYSTSSEKIDEVFSEKIIKIEEDLDGDGVKEKIEVINREEEFIFKINNRKYKTGRKTPVTDVYVTPIIVDIVKDDAFKEIALYDPGFNEDNGYSFYRWDRNNINYLGSFSIWPEFKGDGTVIVGNWMGFWHIYRTYKLTKDKKLEFVLKEEFYPVKAEGLVNESFSLYKTFSFDSTIICDVKKGDKVRFIRYNGKKGWYEIKRDNEIGWIPGNIYWKIDGLNRAD